MRVIFPLVLSLAMAACHADGAVYGGYDVVYVDPPVIVASYPHVYYEGAYVYYINGYWYRSTPRGWARFVVEPPPLRHYHAKVVVAAPRHVARPHVVHSRPPVVVHGPNRHHKHR